MEYRGYCGIIFGIFVLWICLLYGWDYFKNWPFSIPGIGFIFAFIYDIAIIANFWFVIRKRNWSYKKRGLILGLCLEIMGSAGLCFLDPDVGLSTESIFG